MRLLRFALRKLDIVERKINNLLTLEIVLQLHPSEALTPRQWEAIHVQLREVQADMKGELDRSRRQLLEDSSNLDAIRSFIYEMGEMEMDLINANSFYDNFLDMLSQRKIPGMGPFLRACDVIAEASLRLNHPVLATLQKPIVYFDRGFGASIRREGVRVRGNMANPVPTIQIPYAKIIEKHTLTSIIHETGHSIFVSLGLKNEIQSALRQRLNQSGAPEEIIKAYLNWITEVFPDFIGFLTTGVAQALNTKEILSLSPDRVFQVNQNGVHPPPYIRVFLILDWCRYMWGRGIWDGIEEEWKLMYPLQLAAEADLKFITESLKYRRDITLILTEFQFKALGNKRIPELGDLGSVSPYKYKAKLEHFIEYGAIDVRDMKVCAQLGFLSYLRYCSDINPQQFDRLISNWLENIATYN